MRVTVAIESQTAEHQDGVALAEIELCGELMIAAAAVGEERLSPARIDEVLDVRRRPPVLIPVPVTGALPSVVAGRRLLSP